MKLLEAANQTHRDILENDIPADSKIIWLMGEYLTTDKMNKSTNKLLFKKKLNPRKAILNYYDPNGTKPGGRENLLSKCLQTTQWLQTSNSPKLKIILQVWKHNWKKQSHISHLQVHAFCVYTTPPVVVVRMRTFDIRHAICMRISYEQHWEVNEQYSIFSSTQNCVDVYIWCWQPLLIKIVQGDP